MKKEKNFLIGLLAIFLMEPAFGQPAPTQRYAFCVALNPVGLNAFFSDVFQTSTLRTHKRAYGEYAQNYQRTNARKNRGGSLVTKCFVENSRTDAEKAREERLAKAESSYQARHGFDIYRLDNADWYVTSRPS